MGGVEIKKGLSFRIRAFNETSGMENDKERSYGCVNCGYPAAALYKTYSLTKGEKLIKLVDCVSNMRN